MVEARRGREAIENRGPPMNWKPVAITTALLLWAATAGAGTLEAVRERGTLRCGTTDNGQGLATIADSGRWVGFFPDICRAVAAAVLHEPERVEFFNLSVGNRLEALAEGAVDLLSEATTWTLGRDTELKLTFAGLAFFDGQGFMVHRSAGAHRLADLRGATVCVQTATTTIANLRDLDSVQRLGLRILEFETVDGSYTAFFNRHCTAVTDDSSALASMRYSRGPDPAAYTILPDVISKEPLSPVVRDDDPAWADIVRWVLLALIAAEEKDIRGADVERVSQTGDAEARRLLGGDGRLGEALGLDAKWAFRAIAAVGNYGELFERHLGRGSPLGLERGPNRLWKNGGLLWAPPVR